MAFTDKAVKHRWSNVFIHIAIDYNVLQSRMSDNIYKLFVHKVVFVEKLLMLTINSES